MEASDIVNTTNFIVDIANASYTKVYKYLGIDVNNVGNHSEVIRERLFDLYEAYSNREKDQILAYKPVSYIVGALIILSNLTVVISSGLILRKGQQPKSTYLLLGNVSLADTIIGIAIIFAAIVDNTESSNPLCIFQIGMMVCPALVSIFSVGLIAVDRYIYILHGLYHQRWFNTTRVRIGILCTWIIGITLGFMPVSGWVNSELIHYRCYYVSLFPGALILLNSLLSILPILLVAVLYAIILVHALKNVKKIKATKNIANANTEANDKLRIYRGNNNKQINTTYSVKSPVQKNINKIKRSASFNVNSKNESGTVTERSHDIKSKSVHNLSRSTDLSQSDNTVNSQNLKSQSVSELSICTIESSNCTGHSISQFSIESSCTEKNSNLPISPNKLAKCLNKCLKHKNKPKKPNEWRAITIVLLTTISFVFSWMPFFITVIFFVFCEEKLVNPKCIDLRLLVGGPLAAVAFLNSILNPLIYAWWHKGFKRAVRSYLKKYLYKCLSRV